MVLFLILNCVVGNADEDIISQILPYLIAQESNGNPNAIGKAGEIGICQISPIVLREYCRQKDFEFLCLYLGTEKYDLYFGDYFFCCPEHGNLGPTYRSMRHPEYNKRVALSYLRRLRDHYLKDVECYIYGGSFSVFTKENDFPYSPVKTSASVSMWDFFGKREYSENWSDISGEEYKLMLVLSAYNAGITKLRRNNYDINKMPASTRKYVRDIMRAYKESQ